MLLYENIYHSAKQLDLDLLRFINVQSDVISVYCENSNLFVYFFQQNGIDIDKDKSKLMLVT